MAIQIGRFLYDMHSYSRHETKILSVFAWKIQHAKRTFFVHFLQPNEQCFKNSDFWQNRPCKYQVFWFFGPFFWPFSPALFKNSVFLPKVPFTVYFWQKTSFFNFFSLFGNFQFFLILVAKNSKSCVFLSEILENCTWMITDIIFFGPLKLHNNIIEHCPIKKPVQLLNLSISIFIADI